MDLGLNDRSPSYQHTPNFRSKFLANGSHHLNVEPSSLYKNESFIPKSPQLFSSRVSSPIISSQNRPASMHEPWYHAKERNQNQYMMSPSSFHTDDLASNFHSQLVFDKQTMFREDLARINEWFHHLSPQYGIYALENIIQSLPYSTPFQYKHDFHASANLAANNYPFQERIGTIGQNRQLNTPEHSDDDEFNRYGNFEEHQPTRYTLKDSHYPRPLSSVAKLWQSQKEESYMVENEKFDKGRNLQEVNIPRPSSAPIFHQKGSQSHLSTHHHHHYHFNPRSESPLKRSKTPQHLFSRTMDQSLSPKQEKGRIPETVDWELLNDVPAWLKSLRLHKYSPIFYPEEENSDHKKKWTWQEMIELSDEQLDELGVKALGARRKMLKVFELVKSQLPQNQESSKKIQTNDEKNCE